MFFYCVEISFLEKTVFEKRNMFQTVLEKKTVNAVFEEKKNGLYTKFENIRFITVFEKKKLNTTFEKNVYLFCFRKKKN